MSETTESHDTDKYINGYMARYSQHFGKLRGSHVDILELGIFNGGSLLTWRDFFLAGSVVGLDINPIKIDDPTGRIKTFVGLQQDTALLDHIRAESAPNGFDIIIDDASHIGDLTRRSFWHLFQNHLKPGGTYVIEDWRTGYWGKWIDGHDYRFKNRNGGSIVEHLRQSLDAMYANRPNRRLARYVIAIRNIISQRRFRSHDWGMVGFVKELVDELGMDMITHPQRGSRIPPRECKFTSMKIFPGQVFIEKP